MAEKVMGVNNQPHQERPEHFKVQPPRKLKRAQDTVIKKITICNEVFGNAFLPLIGSAYFFCYSNTH